MPVVQLDTKQKDKFGKTLIFTDCKNRNGKLQFDSKSTLT